MAKSPVEIDADVFSPFFQIKALLDLPVRLIAKFPNWSNVNYVAWELCSVWTIV